MGMKPRFYPCEGFKDPIEFSDDLYSESGGRT
jgi:hypothetical protein